jgi:HTH-type transcriptional regulator, sugar sensing transcriptional regulator
MNAYVILEHIKVSEISTTMNDAAKQLEKLGLSKKEARLYLVSLETGPATVAKMAQKSGLKRGTIYEFLGGMLQKGILEVTISGKRKLYAGVQPEKLRKIIERQKEILDALIPDLSLLVIGGTEKPKIRFYEGREGMVSAYYEMLDLPVGSEVVGFATFEGIYKIFPKAEIVRYIKKRVEQKIRQKLIMPTDEYAHDHIVDNKKELRETILIPRNRFFIKSEINIYHDKVAIISLGEEQIALIIESAQIADAQRAIFNLLWHSLKK